jgi:hypothetical protein
MHLSAACTADHLPIHSSPFVRRDRRHTQQKYQTPRQYCDHSDHLAGETNTKREARYTDKQVFGYTSSRTNTQAADRYTGSRQIHRQPTDTQAADRYTGSRQIHRQPTDTQAAGRCTISETAAILTSQVSCFIRFYLKKA